MNAIIGSFWAGILIGVFLGIVISVIWAYHAMESDI